MRMIKAKAKFRKRTTYVKSINMKKKIQNELKKMAILPDNFTANEQTRNQIAAETNPST